MIRRAIRNILTIAAALGFLHGGWESCDSPFAAIGSAATASENASSVAGHDRCPNATQAATSAGARLNDGVQSRSIASAAGRIAVVSLHAFLAGKEKHRESNVSASAARREPSEPSSSENTGEIRLVTRNVTGGQRTARADEETRIGKSQAEADSGAAARIAKEQEDLNRRTVERIAREQEELNRTLGARIMRQQEAINRREVERMVRQHTELNRQQAARIAAGQEARDRQEINRIEREENLKNRSALEAMLRGKSPTGGRGADSPAKTRLTHGNVISPSLRARQLERIERALRRTASFLDRAHLPR